MSKALNWTGDRDRVLGPFLYAREEDRHWEMVLTSGDGDEHPGARFRLRLARNTFIVALPQWVLKPHAEQVTCKLRGGEPTSYTDLTRRNYGISLCEGLLSVPYGRQTYNSKTEKNWSCFLPWTQWRFHRISYFAPDGEHLKTFIEDDSRNLPIEQKREVFSERCVFAETVETLTFKIRDFDGEEINVKTKIKEREWRFGESWCRWLSWFRKPLIRRGLDLEFSSESGRRKGSWKGGTIGADIDMLEGETPADALQRYCEINDMEILGGQS